MIQRQMRKLATLKLDAFIHQQQQRILSHSITHNLACIYERIVTMSGPIHVQSDGEWQSLLSKNSVVVADCMASRGIEPCCDKLNRCITANENSSQSTPIGAVPAR